MSSRTQPCLNALTPDYVEGTVVRDHPMVWSLALCPNEAKQDPIVYGADFGVVFLAKSPCTTFIQQGLDSLGLYHSGLEGEHHFRLTIELT